RPFASNSAPDGGGRSPPDPLRSPVAEIASLEKNWPGENWPWEKLVAGSVTDIGSGVEVRAATNTGLPSRGPKRALARPGVRSSGCGITRGGHSYPLRTITPHGPQEMRRT